MITVNDIQQQKLMLATLSTLSERQSNTTGGYVVSHSTVKIHVSDLVTHHIIKQQTKLRNILKKTEHSLKQTRLADYQAVCNNTKETNSYLTVQSRYVSREDKQCKYN